MKTALTYGLLSISCMGFSQDSLVLENVSIDSNDIQTLIEIAELEDWMNIEKDLVAIEYDSLEWFKDKMIHWYFPELTIAVAPTIEWTTGGPWEWPILWGPIIWEPEPQPITKIKRIEADSTTPVGACACTQAAKRRNKKIENALVESNDQSPTEPFESKLPILATIPTKLEYKLQNEG